MPSQKKIAASQTIAGGWGQRSSAKTGSAKNLTPTQQRDHLADWVVDCLSKMVARKEVIEVLKLAQKRALAKKRGRPGKWKGAYGIQMVMEVETLLEVNPGMSKAQAISQCCDELWVKRFGEDVDFERRYYEAANYLQAQR
jgi:hypothetical protein